MLALFKQLHKEDGVAFLLVTHSKEVAAFCERSLELRGGRFIAQHGGDVDIADLTDSRELIVDDSGTVTLPPDVLLEIGALGGSSCLRCRGTCSTMERVEDDRIYLDGAGTMKLSSTCPACFHQYGDSDEQLCRNAVAAGR